MFTRESLDNIPECQDWEFAASLNSITNNAGIVQAILLHLKFCNGPDKIFPRVLKEEAATETNIPLSIMLRSEGKIPIYWKQVHRKFGIFN